MCQCWKTLTKSDKLVIFGSIFLILAPLFLTCSYLFPLVVEDFIQQGLDEKLIMTSKESEFYTKVWQDNSANNPDAAPMYKSFYVFNITNPEEVQMGGKIKVTQIGPFVYRENKIRYSVQFVRDTVSFRTYEYYTFEADKSVGDPRKILVTLPNLGVLGVFKKFPTITNIIGRALLALILSGALSLEQVKPFYTKPVHDFIWGWKSEVLAQLRVLSKSIPDVVPGPGVNLTSFEETTRKWEPSVINTGSIDREKIFQFQLWNGTRVIEGTWATPEKVTGTEGIVFRRSIEKTDSLVAWIPDIKRSYTLKFVEERNFKGINLYRFAPAPEIFQNYIVEPPNANYYQFGSSGVNNLSSVYQGVPLFLSQPHFLNADHSYLTPIEGLSPDPIKHENAIDIEPTSGITMYARKRIQINVQLIKVSSFLKEFKDLPDVLCPYLWLEESGEVTDDLANEFKKTVSLAKGSIVVFRWGGFGIAVLFGLIAVILLFFAFRTRNEGLESDYNYVDLNTAQSDKKGDNEL